MAKSPTALTLCDVRIADKDGGWVPGALDKGSLSEDAVRLLGFPDINQQRRETFLIPWADDPGHLQGVQFVVFPKVCFQIKAGARQGA